MAVKNSHSIQAGLYNIPAGVNFTDSLARGVYELFGDDSTVFSDVIILLPNRRSCRVLSQAFLKITEGKSLILPTIKSIGDIDESELVADFSVIGSEEFPDIPEAISQTKRRLLLADIIQEWYENNAGESVKASRGIAYEQALALAMALITFLDEVQRDELSFSELHNIVPAEFAEHWQITIGFLDLIAHEWPKILEKNNVIDPIDRRNRLLSLQENIWRQNPPKRAVIAAGTTGSTPATRRLLSVILHDLPNGYIILPGLDSYIDDNSLKYIEESHPQHSLMELLQAFGVKRSDVLPWTYVKEIAVPDGRSRLLSEVMRPASAVEKWQSLELSAQDIEGITAINAKTLQEEAGVVALIIRDRLEYVGKTVALVTNESGLSKRVISQLQRWGIKADDSAGMAISQVPAMVFMNLLAETVIAEKFSPISFLALLKHPLATGGISSVEFRKNVRLLELHVLRGSRVDGGLEGISKAINSPDIDVDISLNINKLIDIIEVSLKGMLAVCEQEKHQLVELLELHIECAEKLSAVVGDVEPGNSESRGLWSGDDGRQARQTLSDIIASIPVGYKIPVREYPEIFFALLAGKIFRPTYGQHPRLSILSPMEARLQSFDTVILGELNEGSWPGSFFSPWMSQNMRSDFGLSPLGKYSGLAAHDFVQCCHAKELYLVRAEKKDGAPTLPSAFIYRLNTVLRSQNLYEEVYNGSQWIQWNRGVNGDVKEPHPIYPPSPKPPLSARPRRLSVSAIEKLIRDPYSLYASHILKLRPLEPIDKSPDAADFGNIIHNILENYINNISNYDRENIRKTLLSFGEMEFKKTQDRPAIWAMWWPRFENMASRVAIIDAKRLPEIKEIFAEISGKMSFLCDGGEYILTAKADRIDINTDGNLTVIDYKTGRVPSKRDIGLGLSPQLLIELMMVGGGGFSLNNIDGCMSKIGYWKLSSDAVEIYYEGDKLSELLGNAQLGLRALLAFFGKESTPYLSTPDDSIAPEYSDYKHLSRVKEWVLK